MSVPEIKNLGLVILCELFPVADPGGGGGGGRAPPHSKKIIKNEDLFLYNFVVNNVFCQYLYTI